MKNTRFIKTVAIIGALVLMVLTILPGCNFIGQADNNAPTDGVFNEIGDQLCCPVCSSTDITGPDADEHYVCNACGAQWSYNEETVDVLDNNGDVVTQLELSNGYVSDSQSGGSSSGGSSSGGSSSGSGSSGSGSSGGSSSGSGSSGGSSSGGNATYTTNKNTAEQVKQNIEKIQEVAQKLDESVEITYDEKTDSYTVVSKDGRDTGLFGYKYHVTDKIFYTAEDSWQRNFGFNEVYDKAAAIGFMTYNTFRTYFTYDNLEWMIQFWKGQYGYAFIGAEIGVYTRPVGSDNGTHYACADDDHKFYMTMDVYRENTENPNKFDHLFTRSRSNTWWCTGFVPGTLGFAQANVSDEGTKKLKVEAKIEFYTPEMAQAFMNGLSKVTTIENNAAVAGTKRAVTFVECGSEAEFKSCSSSCKYALCGDGSSVLVSYR